MAITDWLSDLKLQLGLVAGRKSRRREQLSSRPAMVQTMERRRLLSVNAVNDTFVVATSGATTLSVLQNDTANPSNQAISITDVSTSKNGSISIVQAKGSPDALSYTPNKGFFGTDTFTYTDTAADGSKSTASVTVTVDTAPSFSKASYAFSLNDTSKSSTLGSVSASDPDSGDTVTYSVVSNDYPKAFSIDAKTGQLSYTSGLPATPQEVDIQVIATDSYNVSSMATVAVNVTAVNHAPTFDKSQYAFTLADPNKTGTLGQVSATDQDAGQTVTYSLVSNDYPKAFSIDAAKGQIYYNGGLPGTAQEVDLQVTATDSLNASVTAVVAVNVTPAGSAPVIISPGAQTTLEGNSVSLPLSISNPGNSPLTVSVTGLPLGLSYNQAMNRIVGQVMMGDSLGGNGGVYSVTLSASNQYGSDQVTFAWTVTPAGSVPVITSPGPQSTQEQTSVSLPLNISNPGNTSLNVSVTGLPLGVYYDQTTNRIVGLVMVGDSQSGTDGVYNVTISASNIYGSAQQVSFAWTVTAAGTYPAITSPGNQTSQDGAAIDVAVMAVDPAGYSLTYSASGLPQGLSINSQTGEITGTIPLGSAGSYNVTVTATNLPGASATTAFTWVVSAQNPVATSPGNQSGVEGNSVSLTVPVTNPGNYALTFSAANLPPGLSINSQGVISGTISTGDAAQGPYTVTVTISNNHGGSTNTQFTWTIVARNPVLPATANQTSVEGSVISLSETATDPGGYPLTYAAAGLPTGLSIDAATGAITGTVATGDAAQGPYQVTVTASNSYGGSVSRNFTWTVTAAQTVIAAIGNQSSKEGNQVSLQVSSTDPGGYSLTYAASGLPSGLSINATTGLISGTIATGTAANGPYQVTITSSDNYGGSASQTIAWTVTAQNPQFASVANQTGTEGTAASLTLSAVDPAGYSLTYSASGLPPGLTLNSQTGQISGVITVGAALHGGYAVTLTASNSYGGSTSTTLVWSVLTASGAPIQGGTLTFQARNDWDLVQVKNGVATGDVIEVLGNDTTLDGQLPTIVSASTPAHGTVTIQSGSGNPGDHDNLVYTPNSNYTGQDSFTYTVEDSNGQTSTATVTVTVIGTSMPTSASGGALGNGPRLLDNNEKLYPLDPIQVPQSGPYNITYTNTGALTDSVSGADGQPAQLTGSATETVTVTSSYLGNGTWVYSETVFYTYDISGSDSGSGSSWHHWGAYNYVLNASNSATSDQYSFVLTSDDFMDDTVVTSTSTATSGETDSDHTFAHQHLLALLANTTDFVAHTANGTDWYNQLTTTQDTGARSYWYAIPGGQMDGTGGSQGNSLEYVNRNMTYALAVSQSSPTVWIAMGTAFGMGFGSSQGSYAGSGSYAQSSPNASSWGTVDEGGGGQNGYRYTALGTLDPNLGWQSSGSGQSSGSSSASFSYSGSGTYLTSGSGSGNGTWTISGSNTQQGSRQDESDYQTDWELGPTGWEVVSGVASASGSSSGSASYSGSGTYSRDNQGGTMSGSQWASGQSAESNEYQTQSQLGASGWTTTGTASGSASGSDQASYSGTGNYVDGVVQGSNKEKGSQKSSYQSESGFDFGPNGTWVLTSGSASSSGSGSSSSSYSGSGTETTSSDTTSSGKSVTTTHWQSGSASSQYDWSTQVSVVNGAWLTTSGSGSASGNSAAYASNQSTGSYWYLINDGQIDGTSSGSGSSMTKSSFVTQSQFVSGSGSGSMSGAAVIGGYWSTSGTSWASGSSSSSASNSGSGSYDRHITSGGNSASGISPDDTEITGTMDDGGEESGNDQWSSQSELNASGAWVLVSGSGSGSAGGNSHFNFTGSGSYYVDSGNHATIGSNYGDWTVDGTVDEEGGKESDWEQQTTRQVVNGDWVKSGSGSASGGESSSASFSGSGTYSNSALGTGSGSITHSGSNSSQQTWETDISLVNDRWVTTNGTASGTDSGGDDFSFLISNSPSSASATPSSSPTVTVTGAMTYYNTIFESFRTSNSSTYELAYSPQIQDWTLASGSATFTESNGLGRSTSGSGSQRSVGSSVDLFGNVFTWDYTTTVNQDDSGEGLFVGQYEHQQVINGKWAVTDGGTSSSGTTWSNYDTSGSGTYTRFGMSGKAVDTFSASSRIDWTQSDSASNLQNASSGSGGSITGTASGQLTITSQTSGRNSFSASNPSYAYSGTVGKLQESGSSTFNSSEILVKNRQNDRTWTVSNGSVQANNASDYNYSYSGTGATRTSGSDSNGTWDYSGTQQIKYGYDSWSDHNEGWSVASGGTEWARDSGQERAGGSAYYNTAATDGGSYTMSLEGGTLSGQLSRTSSGGNSWQYITSQTYVPGSGGNAGQWASSGTGVQTANGHFESSYTGSGSYSRSGLSGSYSHDGQSNDDWSTHLDFTLQADGWHASGYGDASGSNNWGYSFSGSGSYSTSLSSYGASASGTINGNSSESGKGRVTDDFSGYYNWDVSTQSWAVASGSGSGSSFTSSYGSGSSHFEYHKSSSGSGSYSHPFDTVGTVSGSASESSQADSTWDESYSSTPSNGGWATVSSGSSVDSTSSFRGLSGSGSYSNTSASGKLSESYSTQSSASTTTTWGSGGASGAWSFATSTASGSTSGSYDYTASGASSGSSTTTDSTGTTTDTWTNTFFRHADETYQITTGSLSYTAQSNGAASSTWGSSWGSVTASGNASQSGSQSDVYNRTFVSGGNSGYSNNGVFLSSSGDDHYSYSGSWNQTNASDGGVSYSGTVDNHQWGTTVSNSKTLTDDWQTTSTYYDKTTGANVTTTSGGSDTSTYSSPGSGYDVRDPWTGGGFLADGGTDVESWRPATVAGTGGYYTKAGSWSTSGTPPNNNSGPGGGSGSGTGSGGSSGTYSATATPVPWASEPQALAPSDDGRGVNPWTPPDISYQSALADASGSSSGGSDNQSWTDAWNQFWGVDTNDNEISFTERLGQDIGPLVSLATNPKTYLSVARLAVDPIYQGQVALNVLSSAADAAAVRWNDAGVMAKESGTSQIYTFVGGSVGSLIGLDGVENAREGKTAEGQNLSMGARAYEGVKGSLDLISTATGITGAAKTGMSAGVKGSIKAARNGLDDVARGAARGSDDLVKQAKSVCNVADGGTIGCFVAGTPVLVGWEEPVIVATVTEDEGWFVDGWMISGVAVVALTAGVVRKLRKKPDDEEEIEADSRHRAGSNLLPDDHLRIIPLPSVPTDDGIVLRLPESVSSIPLPFDGQPIASQTDSPNVEELSTMTISSSVTPISRRPANVVRISAHRVPVRRVSGFSRWLAPLLMLSGLVIGTFCFWQSHQSSGKALAVAALATPTTKTDRKPVTVPIEQIRPGQWVVAGNPGEEEDFEFGADIDPPNWRLLTLKAPKQDGSWADVQLLRPVWWLDEEKAEVGGVIDIQVPECGIGGNATVLLIDACPQLAPRPGPEFRVVTATFHHQNAQIIDVLIDGERTIIGATPNHPFWSQDHQKFVRADKLKIGEKLRKTDGSLTRVVSLAHRPGRHEVFNLEVQIDHTYHVGTTGVLVHNGTTCPKRYIVIGEGMDDVKSVGRNLKANGINAKWWQAWGKNFPKSRPMTKAELAAALKRNERWILKKIEQGYEFYDIGLDPTRSVRSPFYELEKKLLKDHKIKTTPLPR